MTSYEFECALVYLAEQIIKTFGKDVGVQMSTDGEDTNVLSKEPLINFIDERKLVRHWAKVYNIKEVWVYGIGEEKEVIEIYDVENGLMRMTIYRPNNMAINKAYTIAELCGEEE